MSDEPMTDEEAKAASAAKEAQRREAAWATVSAGRNPGPAAFEWFGQGFGLGYHARDKEMAEIGLATFEILDILTPFLDLAEKNGLIKDEQQREGINALREAMADSPMMRRLLAEIAGRPARAERKPPELRLVESE